MKYKELLLLNFILQLWNNLIGLHQPHLPTSFMRTTLKEVWEKEYDILHETSKRRYRDNKRDVNQWLFRDWAIMQGNFYPRNANFGKLITAER